LFKVMIVDDELLVRVGIRTTIPWEENGFQVIGDAASGEEALRIFTDKKPQIVITDIKMTGMDGMELARKIRELDPMVGIILLTCYEEVGYLKNAIRLGASDYIIKTSMEPQDLLNAAIKTRDGIRRELEGRHNLESIRLELENQKPIIQNRTMSDFLKGTLSIGRDPKEALKECGIVFYHSHFILIYFKIDDYRLKYGSSNQAERQTIRKSVLNTALQVVGEGEDSFVFELEENDFIYLASYDISQVKAMENGKKLAMKMKEAVVAYTAVSITAAISRYGNSLEDVPSIFSETKDFMRYKVFLGKNCIITYSDVQQFEYKKYEDDFKTDMEELRKTLRAGDSVLAKKSLEEIFDRIRFSGNSTAFLDYTCIQLISLLNTACDDYEYKQSDRHSKAHYSIDEVFVFETLEDILHWMINQFTRLIGHIADRKYSSSNSTIRKAIDFINKNSAKPITLSEVADYVNMSRTYFCQVFKQESGENFIDYLNRTRIEKAKKLLLSTELKNYEIAEKVGYNDNTYFCRIFKQLEGLTPAEFKRK
jgi:two-component system, response regulator YesN